MDSPIKANKKHAMTLSPWQISEVVSTAGPPKAASLRVKRQAATELPRAWLTGTQPRVSSNHGENRKIHRKITGNPFKMLIFHDFMGFSP